MCFQHLTLTANKIQHILRANDKNERKLTLKLKTELGQGRRPVWETESTLTFKEP